MKGSSANHFQIGGKILALKEHGHLLLMSSVLSLLKLKRDRVSFLDQKYTIEIRIRNVITPYSSELSYILAKSDECLNEGDKINSFQTRT